MTDPAHTAASSFQVLGICGSLRPQSFTRRVVELALQGAQQAGADASLLDLAEMSLPFCTGDSGWPQDYPDVERLRQRIRETQAFIWGTPEYHGSFSGVLKNLLDLTDLDEWRGKVVAVVGVSGGSAGPGAALSGLRDVGRGLRVWMLPDQVAIASVHHAFDESGQLKSADLHERVLRLGRDVVRYARLHAAS